MGAVIHMEACCLRCLITSAVRAGPVGPPRLTPLASVPSRPLSRHRGAYGHKNRVADAVSPRRRRRLRLAAAPAPVTHGVERPTREGRPAPLVRLMSTADDAWAARPTPPLAPRPSAAFALPSPAANLALPLPTLARLESISFRRVEADGVTKKRRLSAKSPPLISAGRPVAVNFVISYGGNFRFANAKSSSPLALCQLAPMPLRKWERAEIPNSQRAASLAAANGDRPPWPTVKPQGGEVSARQATPPPPLALGWPMRLGLRNASRERAQTGSSKEKAGLDGRQPSSRLERRPAFFSCSIPSADAWPDLIDGRVQRLACDQLGKSQAFLNRESG
ncbi:uncharacterized protein VTP21DRAFT_6057 [Calcarisporiella thermophila]|uniref:uncharacterized protein n=1 Tax=Calcarisporiella thermophila TaxID=911321 RepID=UPI00374237B8